MEIFGFGERIFATLGKPIGDFLRPLDFTGNLFADLVGYRQQVE